MASCLEFQSHVFLLQALRNTIVSRTSIEFFCCFLCSLLQAQQDIHSPRIVEKSKSLKDLNA